MFIQVKDIKIELFQDMSVKVDGKTVEIEGERTWPGVRIKRVNGNQLYVVAEVGMKVVCFQLMYLKCIKRLWGF